MSGKYRIFLSAVSSEFEHARAAVANDLRARGLEVKDELNFRQERDADTTLRKLHDYIRDCDAVVCIIGKRSGGLAPEASAEPYAAMLPEGFEEATFTQWEFWFARHYDKQLFMYVAREDFVPHQSAPNGEDHADLQARFVRYIEGIGRDRSSFSSVHELCREVLKADWPDHRTPKPNNLPFATLGKLFVGRDEFLEKLRETLTAQTPADLGHIAAITQPVAIHALGGQGKTRAALEYAWKYQHEYDALLFVSALTPEQMRKSIADLCGCLRIPKERAPEDDESLRCQAALDWLQTRPGWFLVIDNVDTPGAADEVRATLPMLTRGHVVITSRLSDWRGDVQSLALEVLTPEAGANLILQATQEHRVTQPDDAEQAREITIEQGHLALGLQQSAAYISRRRIKLATYRAEWAEKKAEVLKRGGKPSDYPAELLTTWDVTFAQMSSSARTLLERLCWLAPAPLPRALVVAILLPNDTDPEEALIELLDWHFLEPVEGDEDVKAHLLVLEITRQQLYSRTGEHLSLQAALKPLIAAAKLDAYDVRTWPILDPLRPHFMQASCHARDNKQFEAAVTMKDKLASLYAAKALPRQAEPLYREALNLVEDHFGQRHVLTSQVLNNLAGLLQDTGRLKEAEPLLRRALEITQGSYGNQHPNVAICLNNLAQLLQDTNRPEEAEALMRRALKIDETNFGGEHPKVAIRLNNIAQLLHDTYRFGEAELLMRRSLKIDEASYGIAHPYVAIRLNNLALLLKDTKRLEEAEPLMRRALAIDEMSYGPDHPKVAIDLCNLALLLQAADRRGEAEPHSRRAVEIFAKCGGATGYEHPHFSVAVGSYFGLLAEMGLSRQEIEKKIKALLMPVQEAGGE